jgi:hypothetical protein
MLDLAEKKIHDSKPSICIKGLVVPHGPRGLGQPDKV